MTFILRDLIFFIIPLLVLSVKISLNNLSCLLLSFHFISPLPPFTTPLPFPAFSCPLIPFLRPSLPSPLSSSHFFPFSLPILFFDLDFLNFVLFYFSISSVHNAVKSFTTPSSSISFSISTTFFSYLPSSP